MLCSKLFPVDPGVEWIPDSVEGRERQGSERGDGHCPNNKLVLTKEWSHFTTAKRSQIALPLT